MKNNLILAQVIIININVNQLLKIILNVYLFIYWHYTYMLKTIIYFNFNLCINSIYAVKFYTEYVMIKTLHAIGG